MTKRVAAVDCGTNSIRLLVAEAGPGGGMVELDRRLELVRLGQGVDATGEFHPDALQRTFQATEQFAEVIRGFGCEQVRFVATSAARDAGNRDEFFAGIQQRLGVQPEVIPGTEEAELSFQGAVSAIAAPAEPVLVIDIGGGSTELITGGADGAITHAISLDIGSVRLRERFLQADPPTDEQVGQARAHVTKLLDGSGTDFGAIRTFIGVAGTATSMSAIAQGLQTYRRELVDRSSLTPARIHEVAQQLLASTAADIEQTTCLPTKRAEVICAGALILDEIASRVGQDMTVSESDILDAMATRLLQG